MRIKVLFFGVLKDIVGQAEESVTLEEGTSIGRLYETYAARFPGLAQHSASLLFSRNREFAGRSERLREGDEVAFLPPASGGAPESNDGDVSSEGRRTVCRLTRSPIDTGALVHELKRNSDESSHPPTSPFSRPRERRKYT